VREFVDRDMVEILQQQSFHLWFGIYLDHVRFDDLLVFDVALQDEVFDFEHEVGS
jgi:hypothetical protein